MTKKYFILLIVYFYTVAISFGQSNLDYTNYHQKVIAIEEQIVAEAYTQALASYEQLFKEYDFVFRRDYQIASQLAAYTEDRERTLQYIELGIKAGWTLKAIKKNQIFDALLTKADWKSLKNNYSQLYADHEQQLQKEIRNQVKKMYSKDQWKALKALFRFSEKAQTRYAETKFAPHSEQQIAKFNNILTIYGYPGEKLIGHGYWTSTILSHHNSISTAYNRKDTLYPSLRPQLIKAIQNGELSPYQFAIIDDWFLTSTREENAPTYGIIDSSSPENRAKANAFRAEINIRSIDLRDKLLHIEKQTGMRLYIMDIW